MTHRRSAGVLAVGLALAMVPLSTGRALGQQAEEPAVSADGPLFGVSSALVQVDVVVRDRRGRAIRDLKAEDFQVFEDGEPQTIQSFRIVSLDELPRGERVEIGTPATADAAPAPASAPEATTPSPQVIVFVFDRLSTDGRANAHKAATRYVNSGHVEGDIVAVFAIDQALHVLQDFTPEPEAIEMAFDRALGKGSTDFASTRQGAREASQRAAALELAASAATSEAQSASIAAEAAFAAMEARMADGFDRLERDQQGYATTNGLLAIIGGLRAIPGRKTVVFFSEGLSLPSNVLAQFRSVIATANRAQVSVYTIDAGGLRTESTSSEAKAELQRYAQRRERQEASGTFAGGDSPMTQQMERVEDSMRFNSQSGLGQLAEETGGFMVADTNDASDGFERMQEDMRFHYVLAYTPTNPSYDGRFREIRVDVSRDRARVQSRKGYFAVAPDVAVPVRSFEAPAIAALEQDPPPRAFPLKAAALSFPEGELPGRVTVFASMPVGAVAFRAPTSGDRTAHEADFSIVVRISDQQGTEVDRVSQQYPLSVEPASLDSAKQGNVLFYKESELPPGRYVVEAVAYDAVAGSASVTRDSVEVPDAAGGGLRLSTLTLVRRAEKLPPEEQQQSANPLVFGEMMLYPNLGGEAFSKQSPMAFFFTAYGAASGTGATIELLQNGQVAAALPTPLPEPDAQGRIQYAGTLPLDTLPPATYGLRVTVKSGQTTATRETEFTVAP